MMHTPYTQRLLEQILPDGQVRKIRLEALAPSCLYASPPLPERIAMPEPVQPSSNAYVLVVDDSPTIRKLVETALRREGYEAESFPDGVEVMRALTTPSARIPHLILIDIGLPGMDGYEVVRRLRSKQEFKYTAIVMLSRRDGLVDKLKSRLAGAQDYITKPFRVQDVLAVVARQLEEHPMMAATEQRNAVLCLLEQVHVAPVHHLFPEVPSIVQYEAMWRAQQQMRDLVGTVALPLLAATRPAEQADGERGAL